MVAKTAIMFVTTPKPESNFWHGAKKSYANRNGHISRHLFA